MPNKKEKNLKFLRSQFRLLILMTIFFAVTFFFAKNYIISEKQAGEAEQYIEQSILSFSEFGEGETIKKDILEQKLKDHFNAADNIHISYVPESFSTESSSHVALFQNFLDYRIIHAMVQGLSIEIYKDIFDVRGKMKNATVKLFGILSMKKEEFIAVGVHELGHYLDIYFLEKKVFTDVSDTFYVISWESTKVLKPGAEQVDFVSGYAMTNKYEDFAESFTYYILHNKDFLQKTQQSEILKQKYDFFGKYLIRGNNFSKKDFSEGEEIQDYYRDITKIPFDLDNFLHFLEN